MLTEKSIQDILNEETDEYAREVIRILLESSKESPMETKTTTETTAEEEEELDFYHDSYSEYTNLNRTPEEQAILDELMQNLIDYVEQYRDSEE